MCSVRHLRPFDARVLVGAGLSSPGQLAEMHPNQLLDRVEQFLATDRGRRILRSGNSFELSRITSWIAAAKNGGQRFERNNFGDLDRGNTRRQGAYRGGYDHDRYYGADRESDRGYSRRRGYRRSGRNGASGSRGSGMRQGRAGSNGRRRSSSYPAESAGAVAERRQADFTHERSETVPMDSQPQTSDEGRLKFYLELASPVVDAPSIGPRMAAKLEQQNICTVDQLLAANPEQLADKINSRRVDTDTVRAWQQQAQLVCRIPNLRGHDAQLLVACGLDSPEFVANMDADALLAQVSEVAQSKEGQRILRGSKEPDMAEVLDWISWASSCRTLSAA